MAGKIAKKQMFELQLPVISNRVLHVEAVDLAEAVAIGRGTPLAEWEQAVAQHPQWNSIKIQARTGWMKPPHE